MPTRIRALRHERGLTQRALAELAGVSSSTIKNIETGATNASLLTLECLSKALDVPVEQLIAQETDPEADAVRASRSQGLLRLRELRQTLRWSRAVLSAKAGCAEETIKRIETGQSFPGSITLKKLAAALNVRVSDLYAPHAVANDADASTFGQATERKYHASSAEPPPSER